MLLIDFKKAFDSLSWNFMYNVLLYFGFDYQLIDWNKLFNKDVEARIRLREDIDKETQYHATSSFWQLKFYPY